MKRDDPPQRGKPGTAGSKPKKPSRQLNLPSRVRKSFRHKMDGLLGADALWSGLFVVVALLLLGAPWFGLRIEDLKAGQIAPRDIEATASFDYPDVAVTEARRQAAEAEIPDIYAYYPDTASSLVSQLASIFREGRKALEEASLAEEDSAEAVAAEFRERIRGASLEVLIKQRFDAALERELSAAIRRVMQAKIVSNRALLERESVILLKPRLGEAQRIEQFDSFLELEEAVGRLRKEVERRLDLPAADERALADFAQSFLNINVLFDREETAKARGEAARDVQTVYTKVERGELLVSKGQRLTQADQAKLAEARKATGERGGVREWLSILFLASTVAFFIYRYSAYHQRAFRKLPHLHALLVVTLVSMMMLSHGVLWLARRMTDDLSAPFNQIDVYPYLIPLGAGAILVALLTNGRIATVYAAFGALLFGATNDWNAYLMFWAMLVQCAGVYAISTYRDRAALLRAGLVVGAAGALSALAVEVLRDEIELLYEGLFAAGLAFVGGALGVGLVISFSLPLVEKLFSVLTDIRLLELSNINNPLLSEFAVKAPGSYNHSLVVGTLAEEGAKAIGANSLFCRVAAFYHDIGKMNKPQYFVENQRGVNPHDRLSPSMSALIIASHVKDGIKMAREAGLPEQIVDIIPQHHGTKLMTYFYERAKKHADPALGPVKEEDFRYPGPKPQTREAAIFMLSDAVEAAARTVDEPTPNRLQEMIRKVTNSIVVSGELKECHLTFSDLTRIQDAFLRILISMYHQRVDYPGFDFRKTRSDSKSEAKPAATSGKTADFRSRRVARGS